MAARSRVRTYKDKPSFFEAYQTRITLASIGVAVCLALYILYLALRAPASTQPPHLDIHGGHHSNVIDVDKMLKGVKPEYREQCANILRGDKNIDPRKMWAPNYEDWFIYNNFYRHENYHFSADSDFNRKLDNADAFGVYLSLGAYQPFKKSLSAFFDVCLGWAGLCAWNPDLVADFFFDSDRSCNTVSRECLWHPKKSFGQSDDAVLCRTATTNVKSILESYEFRDRFGHSYERSEHLFEIDVVMLSIEGSEIELIRCWPFDLYPVKIWAVTAMGDYQKVMDEMMFMNGYLKYEQLSFDGNKATNIYARKDAAYPWTEQTKYHFWSPRQCNMHLSMD